MKNKSYELLEQFINYNLPTDVVNKKQKGLISFPTNMLKLMMFYFDSKMDNNDIDYWMSIGPKRDINEDFFEYKNRMRFQKALVKYRPFIYDYNQQSTINN